MKSRMETLEVQEETVSGYVAVRPDSKYRSTVIHEIYDMMSRTPHATAVTDGDVEWTYDDLRRRSDAVARSLVSRGITRGSVVGMHLARCADAIAVMLGIMSSGCVYLPLDPSYPSARLRFMLEQAEAVAVVSQGNDSDLYGPDRIWLPSPSQLTGAREPEVSESELAIYSGSKESFGPEDCAYILFTSGSTGEPKGVMVTHQNIVAETEWSAKVLGATSLDASATTCSLSFDPSFHEILLPLSVGGTVHVIPHALALGQITRQVSFVSTTPRVADELLRAGQLPPLKALMLGGDVLARDVATRLLSSGRVGTLLNCYGPTECTIGVTVAEVTIPVPEIISIGRPVPGTEVRVFDENGQALPDGEIGEICIFGEQVARGYVNNPVATAERFLVASSTTTGPRRYYRTGDLGYRTDDGLIYFAGRVDGQVKVNGVRIELGEIDAALRSHPQISDAATIAREDNRTVSYVVPKRTGDVIDTVALKKYLSNSLPRFMMPAGIVVISELRKTVNGKLDLTALPEWSPGRSGREFVATDEFDESTASVIQIVADVTGFVGQIRPSDDFIDDLGGTSLGIVRILVELERKSGRRMRISEALADTTVAGLAGLLREEKGSSPADFALNTDGDAPPLFMIHAYLGAMLQFKRIAERLPSNQPVYGFHVFGDSEQSDEVTISSLAEDALKRIREVRPAGQIIITGHSAGGLVAFEVAKRILESGDPEPRVLLMDSPRLRGAFEYYWGEWLAHIQENIRNPGTILRGTINGLSQVVRSMGIGSQVAPHSDDLMALTEERMKIIDVAIRRYKARAYNGSVTVMRTRRGRVLALGRPSLGWASVTRGAPEMIDVPGGHVTMLDAPHVYTVTEKLIKWLSVGG